MSDFFNIDNIEKLTQRFTLGGLGLYLFSLNLSRPVVIDDIYEAEIAILSVAFLSYIGIEITSKTRLGEQNVFRYVDWTITTPILTYTYWRLANFLGYKNSFIPLGVSAGLMSALGYFVENGSTREIRRNSFIISTIFYVIVLIEIFRIDAFLKIVIPKKFFGYLSIIPLFFLFGWGLYPVAFLFDRPTRQSIWNILDFINKPIYTIIFNDILRGLKKNGIIKNNKNNIKKYKNI
jgi:bacteriorhodopsin